MASQSCHIVLAQAKQHLEQKLGHMAPSPELKELLNGLTSNQMMQPIANT